MELFTERNNIRPSIEKTEIIKGNVYSVLFDLCTNYYNNIAWKFSESCHDGDICCGINDSSFSEALEIEIPSLYRDYNKRITKPQKLPATPPSFGSSKEEQVDKYKDFDQYALLDLIEYIAINMKDYSTEYHEFFRHYHFFFQESDKCFLGFQREINEVFNKAGLLYKLSDKKQIERIEENPVLSAEIISGIEQIQEVGIKQLLQLSIELYKSPRPENRGLAVEKIWDALERLKTYYNTDIKQSSEKLISEMCNNQEEFKKLFDEEFKVLTKIGNDFRIRHHKTGTIEIKDPKHYDYFFNRCLSLIALAIQYLK